MIEKQPSCEDPISKDLMPVAEAQRRLFQVLKPIATSELLPLEQALGRVLAATVCSPLSVPPSDNSAMDGYAIHSSDIPQLGEQNLHIKGTAWAGKPFSDSISPGECIRIFTGAPMPSELDTVVIQEHVRVDENSIAIDHEVVAGKNVRMAGEDVAEGQEVLSQGRCLQAADIGVLASLGLRQVRVSEKLKVAFFTTGDELQALDEFTDGERLPAGMLFDSNRYTLSGLLQGLPVDVIDLGIVRDNEQQTREALDHASTVADVVITSGGVSAGEADYVTRVFHELGDVNFWKLAMRPGRPLAFGQVGKASFFGLPGNPVAVMVTFLQFVQPAIKRLSGMTQVDPVEIPAVCQSRLRKSLGRVEYQRGIMTLDAQGKLVVETTGKQGAGKLSSMSMANCLIVLASDQGVVEPGDSVLVQPFHGLLPS